MDKKERRKKKEEEPVKPISPKPANHSRRPPFRLGICVRYVCLCVCGSKTPGDTGMLLTWTRKGKDSNIYYIYTYIYIDWYVTQKSKSGEFVGTFCYCYCYFYLLLLLLLSLCVCVLPLQTVCCCCYDKKNRLLEHNTYLVPCLTHLFYRTLTKSTGIHHRFIVWFLERTIILEDKRSPPSEQISNLPENSLESITIQSNPIQQVQSPRS